MKYKIIYWLRTDIQHVAHIIHIYERLGGIILTKNKKIFSFIQEKYAHLELDVRYVPSSKVAKVIAWRNDIKLVIYTGFQFIHWGYAVQVFHGASDKTYIENKRILLYDLLLLPGLKHRDKLKNVNLYQKPERFKVVGYPKFDKIVNGTVKYTPLFTNKRKTILYAPTWVTQGAATKCDFSAHGESSLPLWGIDLIKYVTGEAKCNLIIKYHYRTLENPSGFQNTLRDYIRDNKLEESVKTIWDADISPYMQQADLLISDISAVCYEWFHLNRPILFANPAPAYYKPSEDPYSNTYAWRAGDVLYNPEDIVPMLQRNLDEDRYQHIRNELLHYAFSEADGHAGERQAHAIVELYRCVESKSRFWMVLRNIAKFIRHIDLF